MPKWPGYTTQKYNDISVHGMNSDQEKYKSKQKLAYKPTPFSPADDDSMAQEFQTPSTEISLMSEQPAMFPGNLQSTSEQMILLAFFPFISFLFFLHSYYLGLY